MKADREVFVERALSILGAKEQAVGSDVVWSQTVNFYPQHWTDRWPAEVEIPPLLANCKADEGRSVSRKRLFELGESVSTKADALNFYFAVCAWGAGTSALSVSRRIRSLKEPDGSDKIHEALQAVKELDGDKAYSAFNDGSQHRVPYLGPAFFTKLMYFLAGQPSTDNTRHPLILDSLVARALGWSKTSGWKTEEYSLYLDVIEDVHRRWKAKVPTDVIEYMLFQSIRRPSSFPSI